jgi:hypothetical protein
MLAASVSYGIWNDTVGLLFTFGILLPVLMTGLIIVAKVSFRGEKEEDEKLQHGRWGRKHPVDPDA